MNLGTNFELAIIILVIKIENGRLPMEWHAMAFPFSLDDVVNEICHIEG